MAYLALKEHTAASVPTAGSGRNILYFDDADGSLKYKDDAGTARTSDNSVYRSLGNWDARPLADQAAATYHFSQGVGTVADNGNHGVASSLWIPIIYIDDADFGTSAKLRVRFQVLTNATAPGTQTFTGGLYPVSAVAGGTDLMTYDLGTVVVGSTVAIVNPSASTRNQGNSGDFAVPADGYYSPGFVQSNTLAANAATSVHMQLQVRNA